MDRLDAMQAFARVVETGSFTRAAATLQTNKTRVTQLVQQLETHLRVKLLNRTTRKVNTTADGAAYYERVLRLLADLDDAETSLSAATTAPRGRLRVDVPAPLAALVLVPALPGFHARYPDIQLDLGVSDRKVDLIDQNVDCVLRGGDQHLQVRGQNVLTVDDGNAYLAAGVAGLGVLWLPQYMARAPLARGELVPLFEDWQLEPMPLYAAFPPSRHVSRKLRVFIDWVVEVMGREGPEIQMPQ
jgi:DNA-binding transcriptional LysR family regulator